MQITLEGKTKEQVAIERLQKYEPCEGYYLAFSGGKDSMCIYHLAIAAGVKFDAHYSVTGIDPPELVQFIRKNYPDVKWEMPQMSIWRYIEKKGLPTRLSRWCCEKLKERGGEGRVVVTGIRWEESLKRRSRPMYHVMKKKVVLSPIIDWTLLDIWDYIDNHQLPYCSLYDTYADRLGCVMCPMAGPAERKRAFRRYPKICYAWHRAALRYYAAGSKGAKRFKDGEDLWNWWLSGKSIKEYIKQNQEVMELSFSTQPPK
jgi:phosphoadenosine phosphosulfate reductase